MEEDQDKKYSDNPKAQGDSPVENISPNNSQPPPVTKPQNSSDTPTIPSTSTPTRIKKTLLIGLIILIITAVIGGIYLYLQSQSQKTQIKESSLTQEKPSPTSDPTLEWKNYIDNIEGFEFKYPTDYSINEEERTVIIYSSPRSCRVKSDASPEDSPYPNLFTYKPTSEVTFKITPREGENFSKIWRESYGYDFVKEEHREQTIGGKRAYYISQGAEMSFSRTMYLVEIEETRALQIEVYLPIYQFECENPAYEFSQNQKYDLITNQILSTFEFLPDTSDWKTYKNADPGIEFKYPPKYYIKETGDINTIVKISDNPEFEKNEFALVITIENLDDNKFNSSSDENILETMNKIGFQEFSKNLEFETNYNFLGDPPWSYYQIAVSSQLTNKPSKLITSRIHRMDEMSEEEGGTEGKHAKITNQILSTFKFIDN